MGDASGMYTSPTGARPQNGGAGQGQGNNEGFNNASFQLDDGDQHLESAGGRRTSIGTMATLAGGAGTPSPAQQEPQAQPMDPLVQSLMSGVRLSNKKISSILDRQSELEASLGANIDDDDGWKALEQLQEQLSGAIRNPKHFERLRRVMMGHENFDDMCERYQDAKAAGDNVDDPKLYTVKPVRPPNG